MLKCLLVLTAMAAVAVASTQGKETEPWFRLKNESGRWWLTHPSFPAFWSFGVCSTNLGDPGQPDNPNYDGLRLFGTEEAWAKDVLDKFGRWRVNTLAGWSHTDPFQDRVPYVVVLHLGSYNRAPWHDLFSNETRTYLEEAAAKLIPPHRNSRNLIGYFSDNELGWWDDTLFMVYFGFDAKSPGKKVLVDTLKTLYRRDFAAFAKEWKTSARSFDDLLEAKKIHLIPGTRGVRAVHKFNYVLAKQYYRLMRELIRKHDPHHLILGDRYIQYYSLATVRASRNYVDVVSTNAGAHWLDGTYTPGFLGNLHRMTGKPVMVTEFYFAAMENRTGNKNTGTAFPKVQTQAERALGLAGSLTSLAQLPYVIGAHWFQFADQPPKGRALDGEDWNFGLVDIWGEEYKELAATLRGIDPHQLHAASVKPRLDGLTPRAPEHPMVGHLKAWNRVASHIPSGSRDQWADCFVTYDADHLYVGLVPMEYGDLKLYEDGIMPESDRPVLEIRLDRWKGSVRYGFGRSAVVSPGITEVAERPGLKHILTLRIPASSFGRSTLRAGDTIAFRATLTSRGRGYRMAWSRTLQLGK